MTSNRPLLNRSGDWHSRCNTHDLSAEGSADFLANGVSAMPARSSLASLGRAAALFVLVAALGCSQSERLPVHPVEGQLTWQGQPLPSAFVVLHPKDAADARALPARAQTDATGK